MKLIFCKECKDVVNLTHATRYCDCGKCEGYYIDTHTVVVDGPCVVLGIDNTSLLNAVRVPVREDVLGPTFNAFVIHASERIIRKIGVRE